MIDGAHDHPQYDKAIADLTARVAALEPSQRPEPPPPTEPSDPAPKPPTQPTEPQPPVVNPPPVPEGAIAYVPAPEAYRNPSWGDYHNVFAPKLDLPQDLSGTVDFRSAVSFVNRYFATLEVDDLALTIDGQLQASLVVDTTGLSDGPHAFSILTLNPQAYSGTFSRNVANGVSAVRSLRQPVAAAVFGSNRRMSGAFAWVDVRERRASPLLWFWNHYRDVQNDDDRRALENKAWVIEGLTHQPTTALYQTAPHLVETPAKGLLVEQINTQDVGASATAVENVARLPANDGPRGVCDLTPYTTVNHGHHPLSSGMMGWLGVTIDGRVVDVDITGEVTTWFGPRSNGPGPKEFVGDPSGGKLWVSQDIWIDPDDHDLHYVADQQGIALLSRSNQRIMRRWPLPNATSAFACDFLRSLGIRFVACAPGGTWAFYDGRDPVKIWDRGFWVRGKQFDSDPEGSRAFIMSDTGEFVEHDPFSSSLRTVCPAQTGRQQFVFFDIDVKGLIGPKNRIYFSWFNSPQSNTAMMMLDPWGDEEGRKPRIFKYKIHNEEAYLSGNPNGHYLWAFATHHHLTGVFLTTGVSNSSFLIHRTYLDHDPKPMRVRPDRALGYRLYREGKRGVFPPLENLFGTGALGYAPDDFRGMSFEEARVAMLPLLPAAHCTAAEIDALAGHIWDLRTQEHF